MTNRTIPGYIGESLRVRGTITGVGDMVIDGRFDGGIDVDGSIEVGPTGLVASPQGGSEDVVIATSVAVRGVLEGSVRASASVAIETGGRLLGDVRADRVALADGGLLEGSVIMDFDLPADLSESA